MICSPIGSPSRVKPTVTDAAGHPVKFPSAENASHAVPGTAWLAFSALGNFTGLPAASVPVGRTREGLPIGLQIMGRHLDDVGVLALSAAMEALVPRRVPPVGVERPWAA